MKKSALLTAILVLTTLVGCNSHVDTTMCKEHKKNCPKTENCPEHPECEAHEQCEKNKNCSDHPACEAFEKEMGS